MITNYCGSEENALYSVAYTISMLAYVVQTSMIKQWTPWLFVNFMKKMKKKFEKIVIYIWGVRSNYFRRFSGST